jgi:hypothetical protein
MAVLMSSMRKKMKKLLTHSSGWLLSLQMLGLQVYIKVPRGHKGTQNKNLREVDCRPGSLGFFLFRGRAAIG